MHRWKAALLALAALGTAGDGLAQVVPATNAAAIDLVAILASADLPGARIGLVVLDLGSGQVIYQHDPDVPLNPASNAKLLTAAVALATLGPDHRFTTEAWAGPARGSVAETVALRGQGDPSLDAADLVRLAREVAASGIRAVRGIVVDESRLGEQHLPPAFDQRPHETAAYRAAVGATSVDGNAMTVHVRPGSLPGQRAIVTCYRARWLVRIPGVSDRLREVGRTGRPLPTLTRMSFPWSPAVV